MKRKKRQPVTVTVYWEDGEWHVGRFLFTWKDSAVRFARRQAMRKKAELVVKNKNGRIGWRNSYGNDPAHRRG